MMFNIMLSIVVWLVPACWIYNFVNSLVDFVGKELVMISGFMSIACSVWAFWVLTLIW